MELEPTIVWHAIHTPLHSVTDFEVQQRRERERERYNRQNLARVAAEQKSLVTTHAGFDDLFMPLVVGGELAAALVSGPFFRERPTAASVAQQWQSLTGRAARSGDPRFLEYLDALLAMPVFEGNTLKSFMAFAADFTRLVGGTGNAAALAETADKLAHEAWTPMLDRRMARAVASMIDARQSAAWLSSHRAYALHDIGVPEVPSDVAVVFVVSQGRSTVSPIEELFDRRRWQRECAELAASVRGAATGTLGEHGIVLLTRGRGGRPERRAALLELAQGARDLAMRRFGFRAHAGIGALGGVETLPARFEACRAAAEQAVYSDRAVIETGGDAPRARPLAELGALTHRVVEAFRSRPNQVSVVLDHYLSAIALRAGFRTEVAAAHLDGLLVQLVRVAEVRGGTEHSIVASLFDEIEGAESYSLPELLGRYRRLLLTLAEAIEAPALADREAKLRRARAYITERFTEPVTLGDAAKVAGFAPSHFSRLFKAWQGTTFERYLFDLRLARAKELLHNTDIGVERVALQAGFGSPIYFFQAFRRATSTTPAEYRKESRGARG